MLFLSSFLPAPVPKSRDRLPLYIICSFAYQLLHFANLKRCYIIVYKHGHGLLLELHIFVDFKIHFNEIGSVRINAVKYPCVSKWVWGEMCVEIFVHKDREELSFQGSRTTAHACLKFQDEVK